MRGRHIAPRHKASRSLSRSVGRAADAVAGVPRAGVTGAVALVGAAAVATGVAVASLDTAGDNTDNADTSATAATVPSSSGTDDRLGQRPHRGAGSDQLSRSATRPALASEQRETKHKAMSVSHQSVTGRVVESVAPTDPRDIAMMLLPEYGWDSTQFSCLDQLYISESNWDPYATNSSSGAYGIPQSLPAEKMATAGADWRTSPATQIEWGFDYIVSSYGTPCSAWSFKQGNNWY